MTRLSMSSIPRPPSLVHHTHFAISGCRSRDRYNFRFWHYDRRIGVASLDKNPRPVAHLYPGSENLARHRKHRVVSREYGGFGGINDENEEDPSVDLLVRFLQNVFKKITKKARKAVRSVLPLSIPTELVSFSVDGVTVFAFLWLAKAFLEVICTLGSVVFVSILIIRGIWYGIAYVQESHTSKMNILSDEQLWSSTRPAM